MSETGAIYEQVFRGLLAQQAVDNVGGKDGVTDTYNVASEAEIAKSLGIPQMDEELVISARHMAVVYTSIAAFENSVRKVVKSVLAEKLGDNWWEEAVPEGIRTRAKSRRDDEQKHKWHTQRGASLIYYTDLSDLPKIVSNHQAAFEDYFSSQWFSGIIDIIERSRNVIMHSGVLSREDVERVGVHIRDWLRQVPS